MKSYQQKDSPADGQGQRPAQTNYQIANDKAMTGMPIEV